LPDLGKTFVAQSDPFGAIEDYFNPEAVIEGQRPDPYQPWATPKEGFPPRKKG